MYPFISLGHADIGDFMVNLSWILWNLASFSPVELVNVFIIIPSFVDSIYIHHFFLKIPSKEDQESDYYAGYCSVQFNHSVVSDSLRPHEFQHTRPLCPSPIPRVQTHVHWVGEAIQPSHPLSSPPPPAFNLSQHQGLFKWVRSSHQMAKVLEFQLQHQFFQWTPRTDLL